MSRSRFSVRRALALAAALSGSASIPLCAQVVHTDFTIPTANANAQGIAVGPDGNLWFTEYTAQKVGRLTPSGTFTEFPVPGNPFTITSGADGNLWFHLYPGQIGKITIAGAFTAYPTGAGFVSPGWICAGPDGNVWFTLFCDDAVYRITPSGAVTRFPVLTGGACPNGITAGSDGNIWFTEHYRNKIGRITPTGTVDEFRIGPVDAGYPDDITAGPDGNLWATDNYGQFHRITTGGDITEVPVGASFGRIVSGGGYLWSNRQLVPSADVLRVTTSGNVRNLPLPDSDHGVVAMAYGPDGAIWAAEAYTNAIGRTLVPSGFFTVAPCRVWDTRSGAPLTPGFAFFQVAGICGVPSTALAIAANVTVVQPGADGFLTAYAAGPLPSTSTMNYRAGQTRANNAVVPLTPSPAGGITIFCGQGSGTYHVVIDVVGFFQ